MSSYAWEKLHLAIHSLAGSRSQRARLADAGICLSSLSANDFPERLRGDFEEIMQAMRSVPPKGREGLLVAAAEGLGELEVSGIIEKIISLHDAVTRREGPL